MNKSSDSPKNYIELKDPIEVTLGPVIGLVENETARILIEFRQNSMLPICKKFNTENEKPLPPPIQDIVCVLTPEEGDKVSFEEKRPLKNGIAMVFAFKKLKSNTKYSVTFRASGNPLKTRESSFHTLGKEPKGTLKVAIVSCNEISRQEWKDEQNLEKTNDLWADLGKRIENEGLDYVFYIGDQIYMDMDRDKKRKTAYHQCIEILKTMNGKHQKKTKKLLLEILRDQYRRTWGHSSIAHVLANAASLMICDDHEIRDDWGAKADDYKEGTWDQIYGELARQVYYEYQRQLRKDINWDDLKSMECEYHHHILNGVGICFIDYRGCRSWFREQNLNETHIGEAQQKWVDSLFKKEGEFDKLHSTIFLSPLPLFLLSHSLSWLASWIFDDIQDHWTYNSVPQLVRLLNLLKDWKKRVTGRELLVIGGDFHLGGWTDVYYQKEKIFQQFVTSAINNEEVGSCTKICLDILMLSGGLSKDYHFKHNGWRRENNYGIVKVLPKSIRSFLFWYSEKDKRIIKDSRG